MRASSDRPSVDTLPFMCDGEKDVIYSSSRSGIHIGDIRKEESGPVAEAHRNDRK